MQLRGAEAPLPGPVPEFFFSPDEMVRRGRELAGRYAAAWREYAPVVQRTMRIERVTDGDELVRVYREMLDGHTDPEVGYVVSLWRRQRRQDRRCPADASAVASSVRH